MPDKAHEQTDKELKRLERQITKEYSQAAKEVEKKLTDYLEKFAKKDAEMQKKVASGQMSAEEYGKWRVGQMAMGERWKEMQKTLTEDLVNADKIAAGMINDSLPSVYALNYNYGTYEVEHGAEINTSFSLYDHSTVENLMKKDPKIIPKAKVDIPKDELWNRRKLTSAITQGILQGESIPKIANRLSSVANMDRNAAIRNARTYTTAAENKGRVDSYKRADDMGIQLEKMWMATLDGRTRVSHRHLDGEIVPIDEEFSNGCEFPGDPDGDPEEIYNCRCTLVAQIKDYKYRDERNDSKLGDMTYEEWKHAKDKQGTEAFEQPTVQGKEYTIDRIEKDFGVIVDISQAGQYEEEAREGVQHLGKLLEEYNSTLVAYSITPSTQGTEGGSAYMLNGKTEIHIEQKSLRNVKATDALKLGENQYLGTTYHEFAHSLSQSREKVDTEFWKEIRKLRKEYLNDINSPDWYSTLRISGYSQKDVDEFLAEGFTQAKLAENPSPYAKKVLEIVDKYFKK